jgi:hypothetical protein
MTGAFFLFSYTGRVKVVFSNFIRSLAALINFFSPLEVKRTCMTVDKQRPACVHILEYLTGITSLRWPIVSFSALGPQTLSPDISAASMVSFAAFQRGCGGSALFVARRRRFRKLGGSFSLCTTW